MRRGTAIAQPPLPLTVTFAPRPVERLETDGPPQIRVYQTVDGQRTEIVNLRSIHDHDAFRAEIRWPLQPGEHLYGLGQDEDGLLDKRGTLQYPNISISTI